MALKDYLVPMKDKSNICFDCATPSCDCPWLLEGKPVPGWTTKPSRRWNQNDRKHENSFQIIACPLHTEHGQERLAKQEKDIPEDRSARTFY